MPAINRQKTVRIPVNFSDVSDITNNTLTTVGTTTIYIPENGGASAVTFKSVMLSFGWEDLATATNINITDLQAELDLQFGGGASNKTPNIGGNIFLSTAENMSGVFGPFDYTAYFNAGAWGSSVTSQTCDVNILLNDTTANSNFRNVIAWLDITYEFDINSTTNRIQSVCIPYEFAGTYVSTNAAGATYATLQQLTDPGGILDGYATPSVKYRWIEIKVNDTSGGSNPTLSYAFDGGAFSTLPQIGGNLFTGRFHTYFIDISSLDTATTHTLQLKTDVASKFQTPVINEWITYEYVTTDSTTAVNYLEIPVEFESFVFDSTSPSSFTRDVLIPESNIQVISAAIEMNHITNNNGYNTYLKVGSQTGYNLYFNGNNVVAGTIIFQHRFDTGSSKGEGVALTSGLNTIPIYLYQSSPNSRYLSNISGLIKIAYLSDVSSTGIDNHTQTVKKWLADPTLNSRAYFYNVSYLETGSVSIPNDDYYIQSSGLHFQLYSNATNNSITVKTSILPGEDPGAGYRVLYSDQYFGDGEVAYSQMYVRARDEFKRYPNDPDTHRLDIQSNREYSFIAPVYFRSIGANFIMSYSGITHIVSGSITGSAGSTSNLQLFQIVDNEYNLLKTGSVTGDSQYEFTVYDNTTNYIVSSYINTSTKELTKSSTPGTGFDIDYTSGGGGAPAGGEFFF